MSEKNILVVDDKEHNFATVPLLKEQGYQVDTAQSFVEAAKRLGYEEIGEKNEGAKEYFAILTDLMFPLGGKGGEITGLSNNREREDENPLGYALMFYAAKQGVPNIAMLTDMNHHTGPLAATFDLLYKRRSDDRPLFKINNSNIMMFDERDLERNYITPDGNLTEKWRGNTSVKNWPGALEKLLEASKL